MGAEREENGSAKGLRRRDLLRRAGLLGAAAAVPAGIAAAPAAAVIEEREQLAALTATESRALNAMVARLVPTDASGPGATEARVGRYIDRALAGDFKEAAPLYAAGLAALDEYASEQHGAVFYALDAARQDAVIGDLEKGVATGFTPNAGTFFETVRTHTLQGMFSDPVRGGNRGFVGWDLIGFPGVKMEFTAKEQRSTGRIRPVHHSASDYAIFNPRSAGEEEIHHGH
jgi:gluconate 2-dehydrogenase gamma chain